MGKGGEEWGVIAKEFSLFEWYCIVRKNPCFIPTYCSHTAKVDNGGIFFKTWC